LVARWFSALTGSSCAAKIHVLGCGKIHKVVRMRSNFSLFISVRLLVIHHRDPTIQVDGGKVVQEGEVELDDIGESGVHSIDHYMGTEQVLLGMNRDWLLLRCHS